MRKSLLFILLAGAAVPALAADDEDNRAAHRESARAERAERAGARAERPQRAQPGERAPRLRSVESQSEDRPAVQFERQEVVRERVERRPLRDGNDESPRPTLEQRREAVDRVREWRAHERRIGNRPAVIEQPGEVEQRVSEGRRERFRQVSPTGAELESRDNEGRRQRFRQVSPTVIERDSGGDGGALRERRPPRAEPLEALGGRRSPAVSRIPREGTQPPLRASSRPSRHSAHHWRGDWRSDRRYNWRDHRRRHRFLFHFGFYADPFGWRYRPYSIGWRMWPSYYRSSYWLNDPWRYRLPYAPPGYRWIRYYDDAILVDTWDGQVVDVIYNFFW